MDFSVSICVYGKDNAEHFRTAMDSIINQTVSPNEIVLVVDGPILDSIQKVIQDIQRKCEYLEVVYLENNVGHGEARRTGIEKCTNNLIAIMDADDICVPDRFERQLLYFVQDAELSVVGGNIAEFVDDIENVVGIRCVPKNDSDIKQYLKRRCPFNQMTVMFKKEDVIEAGGYIDWYCNEDYYLWIRMMQKSFKFGNVDEILCYVRVGSDMYQRRGGWKYFSSEARLQKYMLENKIIGTGRYVINVIIRFIVQVAMPNSVRGFVFRKLARNKI
jgi:glycosyltransferase involved in cell wall biosynthesis